MAGHDAAIHFKIMSDVDMDGRLKAAHGEFVG